MAQSKIVQLDLPPPNAYFWTPKPESGLRPELKSWSTNCGPHPKWDVVGYYTTEEVAAAVLAERAKSEAMRYAVLGAWGALHGDGVNDQGEAWDKALRILDEARAAIRAEPKEQP